MSDVQNVWTTDFNALLVVVTHVKNDCLRQLKKKQVNTETKGIGKNVGSFFVACGVLFCARLVAVMALWFVVA